MERKDLFKVYIELVRPLIIEVEAKTQKIPIGILNEVRAIHDHVARTYNEHLTEEQIKKELDIAERHVNRIVFDCYKLLCISSKRDFEKFEDDYKGVKLGEVDSGHFLPKYVSLKKEAENIFSEAKKSEAIGMSNLEKSLELFEKGTLAYSDVEDFIESESQHLIWAADHQKKQAWKTYAIGFIISIFSGFIVGLILEFILYPILNINCMF